MTISTGHLHRLLRRQLGMALLIATLGASTLQAQSILRYPPLTGQGYTENETWTPPATPVATNQQFSPENSAGDRQLATLRQRYHAVQSAPMVPSIGKSVLVSQVSGELTPGSTRLAHASPSVRQPATTSAPATASFLWPTDGDRAQSSTAVRNTTAVTTSAPPFRPIQVPTVAPAWQRPQYQDRVVSSDPTGLGLSWYPQATRPPSHAAAKPTGEFGYPRQGQPRQSLPTETVGEPALGGEMASFFDEVGDRVAAAANRQSEPVTGPNQFAYPTRGQAGSNRASKSVTQRIKDVFESKSLSSIESSGFGYAGNAR